MDARQPHLRLEVCSGSSKRDQAPDVSVCRKCTRRQTLSEGTRKSVRISEADSSDPQSVKIFESIAGRIECDKIRCSDVDVELAVILPVLFCFSSTKRYSSL